MNRENSTGERGIVFLLPAIGIYVAIGLIVTLVIAFVLSLLISSGAVGEALGNNLAALCCVPGTYIAGLLSAKRAGRRLLPIGLTAGGLFLGILLIISALFLPGLWPKSGFLWVAVSSVIGGVLGALTTAGLRK